MPGFVELWREYLDHEAFQDADLWRLYSWCLMSANYLPAVYRGVALEPGQFVIGRLADSQRLKIPEATFYRRMKALEKMGLISQKANKQFTVVTVLDKRPFEDHKNRSDTTVDTTSDTTGDTATEQRLIQPVITIEQGNKEQGNKEEGPPAGVGDPPKKPARKRSGNPVVSAESITYPAGLDSPEVREAVDRWLTHKRGRGETYKTASTAQAIFQNGDWAVLGVDGFVDAVNRSIGNNWAGIYPDKKRLQGGQVINGKNPGDPRGNFAARQEFLRVHGIGDGSDEQPNNQAEE